MDESLWRAIVRCEPTFDGQFFYGVVTTRVFCRPSCRSRTPLPENVRIFTSVDDAIAAGFRPCKRCRPDEDPLGPDEALVECAKRVMDRRYPAPLRLGDIARELAVSPYHLHRVFRRVAGTTPAAYLLQTRVEAAKRALVTECGRPITDIALAVGFQSASHFSTTFRRVVGCSPSRYRALHVRSQAEQEVAR
ncbi:bifunctional transcriptional activator/DNA repair enzyme AdaA [Alicyclobacillus kakegawensis]|uniref:bifunctional transcriptional activator/DNA repair enzyme AdaA n=1 Tax=Alicyclobacillus kakegawensis TaxID=392012 RepID=UPI0008314744|nr:bifunctional transcriptional activator/DNA repair enzyme AdaA [Alicyclobacillus kakegawensis]